MDDPTILLRKVDLHSRFFAFAMVFLGLMSTMLLFLHWIVVFVGLLTWRPNDLRNEEAEIAMATYVVDNSRSEVHDHYSEMAPSFASIQETSNFYVSTGPLLVAPAETSTCARRVSLN